jgi:hypothetical protein
MQGIKLSEGQTCSEAVGLLTRLPHIHIYIYIYSSIHVYIDIYIYKHIHIDIHIHIQSVRSTDLQRGGWPSDAPSEGQPHGLLTYISGYSNTVTHILVGTGIQLYSNTYISGYSNTGDLQRGGWPSDSPGPRRLSVHPRRADAVRPLKPDMGHFTKKWAT